MAADKRTQARPPQSVSGGHGHVSGIGVPAGSLVSAVPHASESRDGVSPKARLKSAPKRFARCRLARVKLAFHPTARLKTPSVKSSCSSIRWPRAQDEADDDADYNGCADPEADNPAKGGRFRKGLHHNLS